MNEESALELVLRRERAVVLGALVAVVVVSWAYILAGAGMDMDAMETAITVNMAWTPGYALLLFAMWWAMMVAMMLPSAAPMILLHAAIQRKNYGRAVSLRGTAAFAAGYLLVWGGFSLLAVALQWALALSGLLTPAMASASAILGAGLLIAAGIYQLTPLKSACLRRCRAPVLFISQHWRPGMGGAFAMGITHGAFCLGCCWVLMGLLFYGGVMNLTWIIGLALFVLAEKVAPAGRWIGRIAGLGLIVWGIGLLAVSLWPGAMV